MLRIGISGDWESWGNRLTPVYQHQLTVPRCRQITFGRWAFSVAGPTVWNLLPAEFCGLSVGFGDFKCMLKAILFSRIGASSAMEMFA